MDTDTVAGKYVRPWKAADAGITAHFLAAVAQRKIESGIS